MGTIGSEENPIQIRIKQLVSGRYAAEIHDGESWVFINDMSYGDIDGVTGAVSEFLKHKSGGDEIKLKTSFGDEFVMRGDLQ